MGNLIGTPMGGLFAGQLFEEPPVLVPEPPPADQRIDTPAAPPLSADVVLPRIRLRFGTAPRVRQPDNMTVLTMFGSGLLLFFASWMLATCSRRQDAYGRALMPGEEAPPPRPPHVIYSLTRSS